MQVTHSQIQKAARHPSSWPLQMLASHTIRSQRHNPVESHRISKRSIFDRGTKQNFQQALLVADKKSRRQAQTAKNISS